MAEGELIMKYKAATNAATNFFEKQQYSLPSSKA